ncbi:MAG: 30S ribosomal protein S3 [Anaerolineaceae bacterium]|nr:30S ribosomal protein S3 [Anaerolineaceae bacterium]MCY3907933.1 30S ribosomal protein S3 [Anaerolineaceae bacterium]MCY3947042.1 30S ribosomal protein S3 [Anaerolineaceae bacterium]MCY4024364.1 30S ribosomal protein S3 [Anaerolineaceae bacterium]MDD9954885.1 30S ribosomal protein S3 [Anaerolineaceae bacterium]
MGRKVHPVGFRLKIIRDWDARWYAERQQYRDLLQEDFAIRRYIGNQGSRAAISRVEIERYPNQLVINIHTARPGIVIGRKGEAVKQMRSDLEKLTDGKKVKVEVSEIDKPDTDAKLVAENISGQLERRIGHSRAIKRAIGQAMRQGAQGIRIEVSGRLGGSDMARREWQTEGRIPRNTLRADVDYGTAEALTTFGRIGVKVWVYNGEVLDYGEIGRARVGAGGPG